MVKKIITDKNLIRYLTNREGEYLVIEYNIRYNRAWFKTETMPKRKPIDINRVVNLLFFHYFNTVIDFLL